MPAFLPQEVIKTRRDGRPLAEDSIAALGGGCTRPGQSIDHSVGFSEVAGPGLQLDLATPPETGEAIGFLPQPAEI